VARSNRFHAPEVFGQIKRKWSGTHKDSNGWLVRMPGSTGCDGRLAATAEIAHARTKGADISEARRHQSK
jgi:hypothetical protein